MTPGIFSIGKINPDNVIQGIIRKNVVIIACCCVLEIVDISIPMARVFVINIMVKAKSKGMLPFTGILNQKTPATKTITASINPININGKTFPKIS